MKMMLTPEQEVLRSPSEQLRLDINRIQLC
jgi:hypothetical protein